MKVKKVLTIVSFLTFSLKWEDIFQIDIFVDVSDQLVRELLIRDQLHTKQDALLMDVEDAVKYVTFSTH